MYVLSRVAALTGLYLHSSIIRLLKHLSIRLAREKEALGQHEKADVCWPVSLFFQLNFLINVSMESLYWQNSHGFPDSLTERISYRAL